MAGECRGYPAGQDRSATDVTSDRYPFSIAFDRRNIMNDKSPAGAQSTAPPRQPINLRLGRLPSTPGAIAAMAKAGQDPLELINRHRTGDWGDVDAQDWAANEQAVMQGERVLSAFTLKDGVRVWIISESDRAATTLLLPS